MAVVIAVDPGLKSGVSILHVDENQGWRWEGSFIMDVFEVESYVETWMSSPLNDELTIVCESFIINARTARVTQAPWSLEVIGCLRYLSQKLCGKDLVMQTPSEAKSFSTNEKLKKIGWYRRGTAGHDNDASRHLLLYAARQKILSNEDLRELL